MKISHIFAVVLAVFAMSVSADELLHSVTGDVVLNTDDLALSGGCTVDTAVTQLSGEGFEFAYFATIEALSGDDITCQFVQPVTVPDGWSVSVYVENTTHGSYIASGFVSSTSSLAGETVAGDTMYLTVDSGEYAHAIDPVLLHQSECGADFSVKSLDNVIAFPPSGYVSMEGMTKAFVLEWTECTSL